MTEFNLLWLAPLGSILALAFSAYLALSILKKDRGTERMRQIADAVKKEQKHI